MNTDNSNGKRHVGRASGAALTLTLLLVNAAAIWGQAGWALSHIVPTVVPSEWAWSGQIGIGLALAFACAIEGVGVFLALSADEADEAGLPSGGTRLASYGVGLFVSGGLNLSHWGFVAAGIAFAFLSAISPFLWGVRARIRRGRSIAPSRRLWHPLASIKLIRVMAWEGIATEDEGMAHMRSLAGAPATEHAPVAGLAIEPAPVVDSIAPAIEPAPAEDAPRPVRPARDRAPRRGGENTAKAIEALKDGLTPALAAERSGLSVPAVRKYRQVMTILRDNPNASIDTRAMGVRVDAVDSIRAWARLESVR